MKELTEKLYGSQPTDVCGEIVTWSLNGKEQIPVSDIVEALKTAGIDEKYCKDMKPRSAFTRACKDLEEKRVIRILDQNESEITFQFNHEEKQGTTFQFPFEGVVTLNKTTGAVTCDSSAELASKIETLILAHMQKRTPSDISRLVQLIFKDDGDLFPINEKGVAYLVPEQFFDRADRIETFLDAVGGRLQRFPIPRNGRGEINVSDTIDRGLRVLVQELDEATDGWDDSTRPSTTEKHLKKFELARFKVRTYAGLLNQKVGEINSIIAQAEQKARSAAEQVVLRKQAN